MMGRTVRLDMRFDDGSLLARVMDSRGREAQPNQRRAGRQGRKEDGGGGGCCAAGDVACVILPFLLQRFGRQRAALVFVFFIVEWHVGAVEGAQVGMDVVLGRLRERWRKQLSMQMPC
jgi:hypothetical protein